MDLPPYPSPICFSGTWIFDPKTKSDGLAHSDDGCDVSQKVLLKSGMAAIEELEL
jgi:hypothetical protein